MMIKIISREIEIFRVLNLLLLIGRIIRMQNYNWNHNFSISQIAYSCEFSRKTISFLNSSLALVGLSHALLFFWWISSSSFQRFFSKDLFGSIIEPISCLLLSKLLDSCPRYPFTLIVLISFVCTHLLIHLFLRKLLLKTTAYSCIIFQSSIHRITHCKSYH